MVTRDLRRKAKAKAIQWDEQPDTLMALAQRFEVKINGTSLEVNDDPDSIIVASGNWVVKDREIGLRHLTTEQIDEEYVTV